MNSSLSKYLSTSIEKHDEANINESLVLGAIVASTCLAYAVAPVLNTDFMKSVGAGIGGLLNGIGNLFGGFNIGASRDNIKELLKKDPDDLTGKEKNILKKASNNKRLQKDLSNNELKALEKALGKSNNNDSNEIDDDISKEVHALLKKKPDDLTPREKKRLSEIDNNYDLSDELSDAELKRFKQATGTTISTKETNNEDDGDVNSDVDITPAMLMMAKKANENEKDEAKKSKNNSLIDIITASIYDENGNIIPLEKRAEKMKSIIGEGWEDFKSKMEKKIKDDKNSDEFKKALENAKNDITDKDVESFMTEAKENAKKTHERIAKEKAEQEKLDKQIEEIENKLKETETEEDTKKLKEELEKIKKEKDELSKKSLVNQIKETDDTAKSEKEDDTDKSEKEDDTAKSEKEDDTAKPKDYTDKEIENIQNELSDLNPETDKDKIKEKEDLLKSIAKAKGKNEDEFIPKEAEVTDPDTGKKIKRVIHTGPKGGRFYYPDGKPKTPEHKVYVQESKYSKLSDHLNKELKFYKRGNV